VAFAGFRGRLYCDLRSIGLDDSGGAGLNARMRVFSDTPQADASDDSYAMVSRAGLVYEAESSLSFRLSPSRAAVASSSELLPPTWNALAALARTVEPSPLLVLGRTFSASGFAEPAIARPSLAVRLGMKRSPASRRIVVLPDLVRSGPFLRLQLFDGVCPIVEPVPVNVQSETPNSRCLGVCLPLAIFDFGESRWADLDADFAKYEERLPYVEALATREESAVCLGGVNGDE